MGRTDTGGVSLVRENKSNYAIRQGACLVSMLIHLSLFWGQGNAALWALVLFQGLVYPALLFKLRFFHERAPFNLLLDNALYSFCVGMWGFNPFLVSAYAASASIINMSAGGTGFFIRGLFVQIAAALVGGLTWGFYYRDELPLLTQVIASTGMVFFMAVLGMRIHRINSRLRAARNNLQVQREELLNLNTLALAVNTHLDVDIIMKSLMQAMERLFPFEALYILTYDEPQQKLEVLGIYGSGITEQEHAAFRKLRFDLRRDRQSLFVRALENRKVVYIPEISPEAVRQGARIDSDLYGVKPSVSIAYFPILVEDRVVAGAAFINYQQRFYLEPRDIELIQQFLVQVGTAVRNATLFKELVDAKEKAEIAQREAQASEETKSRFLANMSHEIRTPLTAIMGYSEALTEAGITEEERHNFIGHILRSGKHLLSMINDILDISKIEAHKIEVELLPCNLLEVLCDLDSYMKIRTREKDLHYQMDLVYPLPETILTDPTRLKQILLNLCNNATKFTAQGSIILEMRLLAGELLQILVSDTGIGIEDEVRDKIFRAFDQADTSTTRLFGGTGLGLYISKNLAQLLGGDLTFTSRKGVGSTFKLTLPVGLPGTAYIRDSLQFNQAMHRVQQSKIPGGVPQLSGAALVAEDNPENQHLIARLIRQTGMEVDVVDNGEKAVQAALQKNYSVILMDMQMPVMGGREACAKLRSSGVTSPMIAFTANVMKHQMEEYERQGFNAVVEKPLVRERLFETLKQVIDKSQQQRSCKVLIAEDNEVNQMILFRYVTRANQKAEITLAANGLEALEWAQKKQFDLILMDMEMPVLSGLEATRRIRALGQDMPLYIVSGNVSHADRERCEAAGATGHLAKPLDREHILTLLGNLLR
jgi:signal transduction histidine kinase/CheY-like chemotaxis protein